MSKDKGLGWHRTVPVLAALLVSGCGPEGRREDLGKVIFQLPQVAGSDKPYPIPPLETRSSARATEANPPLQGAALDNSPPAAEQPTAPEPDSKTEKSSPR